MPVVSAWCVVLQQPCGDVMPTKHQAEGEDSQDGAESERVCRAHAARDLLHAVARTFRGRKGPVQSRRRACLPAAVHRMVWVCFYQPRGFHRETTKGEML